MKITVDTKITVTIKEQELVLSKKEAEELYRELKKALGTAELPNYIPVPYEKTPSIPNTPYIPTWPEYPPHVPPIWCGTDLTDVSTLLGNQSTSKT